MLKAIRDALIAAVDADFAVDYPGVPLVHDNAPFDWASLPDRFVVFEVEFAKGEQIGVSGDPATRHHGFVYLTAYIRNGKGAGWALNALSWFDKPKLAYQVLSGTGVSINLQALDPIGHSELKGFYIERAKVAWRANPA